MGEKRDRGVNKTSWFDKAAKAVHRNPLNTFSSSGWVLAVRRTLIFEGRIIVMICLPVHSGFGLMIAGTGIRPSQKSNHLPTRVRSIR